MTAIPPGWAITTEHQHCLPNPKAPPKTLQAAAKAERARRKACHGTWHPCHVAHPVDGPQPDPV